MTRPEGRSSGLAGAIASRAPWLSPALVVLIGLAPTAWALRAQTFAVFGRDQGIFQYVAWALRTGDHAYRDIHEINGPLPHAWHMVMQALGGEDEHVFRSIDTVMLVTAYAFAASTLPRWVGLELGEGKARLRALLWWSAAGVTVLGAQYVRYDFWHTAQREALYAVLVLASLALQAIGQTTRQRRRALASFAGAAALTSLAWFGKPPCAIFSLLQLIVLLLDRRSLAVPLRAALAVIAASALFVSASMVAFVMAYGDVRAGVTLLSKVPRLHHTIWNETLLGAYRAYGNAPRLDWAMASFAGLVVALRAFKLPRRALLAVVLPLGGALVFSGQGKAFPYHMHMLTLGTGVAQLVILGGLAKYVHCTPLPPASVAAQPGGPRVRWAPALAVVAALAATALGVKSAEDSLRSPGVRGGWAEAGATAEQRASKAYLERFPWGDFFASDLRDAAGYLAAHTRPDERVQTYGFDPYLLFLARRRSASPVIYGFELNVDAALEGGPGARPSPELRQWLLAYRDEAEALVSRSVEASPPAAFVLFDRAPFTHPADGERDFEAHCPRLFAWMRERYTPAARFGTVRIWLRSDVAARGE